MNPVSAAYPLDYGIALDYGTALDYGIAASDRPRGIGWRYVAAPAGGVVERLAALTAPPSAENRPSTEK